MTNQSIIQTNENNKQRKYPRDTSTIKPRFVTIISYLECSGRISIFGQISLVEHNLQQIEKSMEAFGYEQVLS
jgi:hypothetical protein